MWKKLGKTLVTLSIVLFLVIGVGGYVAWSNLFQEIPVTYDSPEDQYKYGSIGTEVEQGIPFWIWLTLPRLFPDYLPDAGGYPTLGVTWEAGRDRPVGFTKKTIGYPRVALNCAACHTQTSRQTVNGVPTLVPTGTVNSFDWTGYLKFLNDSGRDPRFTGDYVLDEISYEYRFSTFEKLLYRFWLIPQTHKRLVNLDVESGFHKNVVEVSMETTD